MDNLELETCLINQLKAVNRALESTIDNYYTDTAYKNIMRRNKLIEISQEIQEELIEISHQITYR